ncbi:hypothetical protein NS206_12675 [Microbacterium testaceum]|uniref:sigma-70 family RNA polymerase sigma factor n=1 Tax=Microbacterium testaceum TaxID=2033 RepID=UPI0007995C7A|nr:sigma-70 family RNA polymerase sigma factor [Microbacterium testaceum]KTS58868.1 hypothetical protein NS206_12675 [Microbacterium testaceum]
MTAQPTVSTLSELADRFALHRAKLFAIAHRTLGSPWSADDALQEVWIRLQRAKTAEIDNLEAWLTTVVSRVCIDMIRQQASRREEHDDLDASLERAVVGAADSTDPAHRAMRSDDLALAMQVVLDTLGPLERLALVLHDVFALSYDDIAPIVERTPVAARQLASRARARVRAVDVTTVRARHEVAIAAFLEAARDGDFARLLQMLDPEIEVRSDPTAVQASSAGAAHGAPLLADRVRGADAVARVFAGRAALTRPVLVGGVPSAAYITSAGVNALYLVGFQAERIVTIDVLANADHLSLWTFDRS